MSTTTSSEIIERELYLSNGKRWAHYFIKNGKLHGESKLYHDSGELHVHCFRTYGKMHGEYKAFDENGSILRHCFYYNDTQEVLSEYIEDPNNITDAEFMNLSMVFGNNFFATNTFTGAVS